MPALQISLDGISIATISTDALDLLNIRVSGLRINEAFANLDVSGGTFRAGGQSSLLTWISLMPLQAGQTLRVTLQEYGESTLPGKTNDELIPDEPDADHADFSFTNETFQRLRAMPRFRERYRLRLNTSTGASYSGETNSDDYSFAFSLLWDVSRPRIARISLHSSTIEALEAREICWLFKGEIAYGDSIELLAE